MRGSTSRMAKPNEEFPPLCTETAEISTCVLDPSSPRSVLEKKRTAPRWRRLAISTAMSTPDAPTHSSSERPRAVSSWASWAISRNEALAVITRPSPSVTTNPSGAPSTAQSSLAFTSGIVADSASAWAGVMRTRNSASPSWRKNDPLTSTSRTPAPPRSSRRALTSSTRTPARTAPRWPSTSATVSSEKICGRPSPARSPTSTPKVLRAAGLASTTRNRGASRISTASDESWNSSR